MRAWLYVGVRVDCKLSGRITLRECAHLNAWSNLDMAECPRRVQIALPGFCWWSREAEWVLAGGELAEMGVGGKRSGGGAGQTLTQPAPLCGALDTRSRSPVRGPNPSAGFLIGPPVRDAVTRRALNGVRPCRVRVPPIRSIVSFAFVFSVLLSL